MSRLLATALYVGDLRPAPGTWGSLLALLLAVPALALGGPWLLAALIGAALLGGAWAAGREMAASGDRDPSHVVIDEVAGQWIALLPVAFGAAANGVPATALWPGWLAAFALFRLLDVWKPGPIGRADGRGDVLGLLLDDVLAGAGAALGVVALAALFHIVILR